MINKLKRLSMRATPQRMAILKMLEGNTSHPSAEDIYRKLKPEYPSLSPATVYNTLEALAKAGEIQEIGIDPERRRFDPNPLPHCHFLCNVCRRVYDFDINLEAIPIPKSAGGFRVNNFSLYLYGICPNCSSTNENQEEG